MLRSFANLLFTPRAPGRAADDGSGPLPTLLVAPHSPRSPRFSPGSASMLRLPPNSSNNNKQGSSRTSPSMLPAAPPPDAAAAPAAWQQRQRDGRSDDGGGVSEDSEDEVVVIRPSAMLLTLEERRRIVSKAQLQPRVVRQPHGTSRGTGRSTA